MVGEREQSRTPKWFLIGIGIFALLAGALVLLLRFCEIKKTSVAVRRNGPMDELGDHLEKFHNETTLEQIWRWMTRIATGWAILSIGFINRSVVGAIDENGQSTGFSRDFSRIMSPLYRSH